MSNSIILKNILNNESCELKQTIDNFMEESFNKLQMLMKSKVDKIISDKLDLFYNKEFDDEREKILFDQLNEKSTKKYFMLEYGIPGDGDVKLLYYKNIIITQRNQRNENTKEYIYNHNFTIPMLFIIKYCNPTNIYYTCGIGYNYDPEYFQKKEFQSVNSSDFKEICKKEYNVIEEKKVKLENLIEDYTNKKEYYESLEKQIIEARLEVENIKKEYSDKYNKEYIELEEEKLRLRNLIEEYTNNKNYYELEEKNKKNVKNKNIFIKEDKNILEYKSNTNDIDENFDGTVNQFGQGIKYNENCNNLYEGESQNDKQNKTEFQRIINEAQKKPSYFKYKDILLSLVTKEENNYPIYKFITPFMPSIKSHNFKHFYQSLQQPKRKDEWINIIHNTVLDIENGDYELQQMLDLIIDKCYININQKK